MKTQYIGADVHCTTTDLAVNRDGVILDRWQVPTTVPRLREVLETVRRPNVLVMEEGVMADCLRRNLREVVTRVIVCDPRHNRLISHGGDKTDPIDAEKLSQLARGGYVREVHHSDDDGRALFKQWTSIYHERVDDAVRQVNKLRMRGRSHGVHVPSLAMADTEARADWLKALDNSALGEQLGLYWPSVTTIRRQVAKARRKVLQLGRAYPIVASWQAVPGIGPIRASTFLAYVDTPWRFRSASCLNKYCGVGLRRVRSGTDRHGRPKPGYVCPPAEYNRRLKDALIGATLSALMGQNSFAEQYRRLLQNGLTSGNARRAVARRLLKVLWGMWKTNQAYDPERI